MFWCNHHHQGAHYLSLLKILKLVGLTLFWCMCVVLFRIRLSEGMRNKNGKSYLQ